MSKKQKNEIGVNLGTTTPNNENSVYISGIDITNLEYGKKYSQIKPYSGITLKTLSNILKNPQEWTSHKSLLQYCAYYSHFDNMLSGALFNIFIPFSVVDYRLNGGSAENREKITQWLEDNSFSELLEGMATDYYMYGRFVSYLYDNNVLQILPVFRCEVESLEIGGNPIISFEINRDVKISKTNIGKLEKKYAGYPSEIVQALKNNKLYAQLDNSRTYSCSFTKSAWEKYPVPMLTSSLQYVIKKEMLSKTEDVELNNMSKSLLQVQVGDKEKTPKPSESELMAAGKSFVNALKSDGASVAVVAWNVEGKWLTYENKEVLDSIVNSTSFQNWNILSALSISPVLSAGSEHFNKGTSGSFSQTTAAIGTINKRINGFLSKVAKLLNRIIKTHWEDFELDNSQDLPKIIFDKVDLSDNKDVQEELIKLYDRGLISNKTFFERSELDYNTEKLNREEENKNNEFEVFKPRPTANQMSWNDDKGGRPIVNDNKRKTDKNNSLRSNNMPK